MTENGSWSKTTYGLKRIPLSLPLLPPRKEISFDNDANGTLEVTVEVMSTGNLENVVIIDQNVSPISFVQESPLRISQLGDKDKPYAKVADYVNPLTSMVAPVLQNFEINFLGDKAIFSTAFFCTCLSTI